VDTGELDLEFPDYKPPQATFNCSTYYDGTLATVAGWGATYKADSSCELRAATTRIYANWDTRCLADEDGTVLAEDKICAYNSDWDTDASCQASIRRLSIYSMS
jgi:hypothetical protein